ncbi:zinc finger domain-containing protein [Allonocardiopsis opalescens]|uniref:DNA-binding phage zinc finger domain-containing protein n=1 Tax=Allonocardiopsis opalescens TaxID=1144618 RepID=A0A2T0PP53_9ACTN|nr:hypothetical protein [Allonocardiopsis opalescens]PRX90673.1 hypothetical protein CLV72_11811 [Allonocardiopsis opalescens]
MTPSETVVLTRYVKALFPHQQIDEYTPDAWHDALADIDAFDARTAVADLAKSCRFIGPADIVSRVRAIRNERLSRTPLPPPPPDARDYQRQLQESIRRIADGKQVSAIGGGRRGSQPSAEYRAARTQGSRDAADALAAALTVPCPALGCGAQAGARCVSSTSGRPLGRGFHPTRLDRAVQQSGGVA